MAVLSIPDKDITLTAFADIKNFCEQRGILLESWEASQPLHNDSTQEEILTAYAHELKPFMAKHGFVTADVINVHPGLDNLAAIRGKFLPEHTHSEDEIRFFVDGEGLFWFHLTDAGEDEVFNLKCEQGDFISVPAGYKHWFDLAPNYFVKAIRIFSNEEGWVAHYTGSGVDQKYNP